MRNPARILLIAATALATSGCGFRDTGVSREREAVAAQAFVEMHEATKALRQKEGEKPELKAQTRWFGIGMEALHAVQQ